MQTGIIAQRRGLPIYKSNPSIPKPGEIQNRRRARLGSEAKGLVVDGSGEVLGTGIAIAYEWEEVDDERFVKLFLAGLKQAVGLSKSGLAVFELVYNTVREAPRQDFIPLSVLTCGLTRAVFYKGLKELLQREFLYQSPAEGMFFVNVRYMFNGDRLAFVKGYHRKGRRPAKHPDQAALPFIDAEALP